MRLADPDSAGRLFRVDTLHAVESVPTFRWRNVQATVRQLGDSVWIEAPHWDLPASTGRAAGKVVWGSDLPVRYAIRIWGDSVSLNDVAWVYPTLPRTGGGTMILDIKNERNLKQLDYAITEMDVRTTKSRLRGDMTFEVGGPVLAVHDVKMRADPVDFDLLRTLNGKPFPADWQGTITGTVNARGGPLTHFFVDAADVTFRDKHVPGAVSKLKGRGELDILFPAFTAFHRFNGADRAPRPAHAGGDLSRLPARDGNRERQRGARLVVARRAGVERQPHAHRRSGRADPHDRAAGASRTARSSWATTSRCRRSRCRSRRSRARTPCCRCAARSPARSR